MWQRTAGPHFSGHSSLTSLHDKYKICTRDNPTGAPGNLTDTTWPKVQKKWYTTIIRDYPVQTRKDHKNLYRKDPMLSLSEPKAKHVATDEEFVPEENIDLGIVQGSPSFIELNSVRISNPLAT